MWRINTATVHSGGCKRDGKQPGLAQPFCKSITLNGITFRMHLYGNEYKLCNVLGEKNKTTTHLKEVNLRGKKWAF